VAILGYIETLNVTSWLEAVDVGVSLFEVERFDYNELQVDTALDME